MIEKSLYEMLMLATNCTATNPHLKVWFKVDKEENKVIFNEPATILYKDGKKYVCKCDNEDKFSEELGLALCLLKSFGVSYSDFEEMLKGAKRQGVKNEKD